MKDSIDPETGDELPDVDDAPDFDPELGTLMGDMRDAILMRIRTLPKPWAQMTEAEQTDCANGAELAAREIIRKTVRLVNKHQWPHVVASLSEIKIGGKNGIDIKMTSSNIAETRDVLGEHVGTHVQIVMADSDAFMAERAPAQIDKDQPEMDLQDGEGFDGAEANRPDEGDLE